MPPHPGELLTWGVVVDAVREEPAENEEAAQGDLHLIFLRALEE